MLVLSCAVGLKLQAFPRCELCISKSTCLFRRHVADRLGSVAVSRMLAVPPMRTGSCRVVSFRFVHSIETRPRVPCLLAVALDCRVARQAALLYTSSSGQRRVRCHTLALPVTGALPSIFRSTGEPRVLTSFWISPLRMVCHGGPYHKEAVVHVCKGLVWRK